jgi:uracil-DNA glycosylase family 4
MAQNAVEAIEAINQEIIRCRRCPRLVEWREQVAREKRSAFADEPYWGRPVPLFGDFEADRLIVGLAPAAHGANRTGRMFTGDRSGDWLYRALHKAGVASQAESTSADDGLELTGVLIAASAHCAPPANKPLPEEMRNCSDYLSRVLATRRWRAILCLGSLAWNHVHNLVNDRKVPFGHAVTHPLESGLTLVASYHPSQQNTFTGKLTEPMLDDAVRVFLQV